MLEGRKRGAAERLPALTGIRAFAAGLVLLYHIDQVIGGALAQPIFKHGYVGVDLFFVLSGYIICHVYFTSLRRPNRKSFLIFIWHRFIRLYPAHMTVLIGLVVVVALASKFGVSLNHPENWQYGDLIWHVALVQAWGLTPIPTWNSPSWSISAEWFAYLLFPLVAASLARVGDSAVAFAFGAFALIFTAIIFLLSGWSLDTGVGLPALVRVAGEFFCGAAFCRGVGLLLGTIRSNQIADVIGCAAIVAFVFGLFADLADFVLVGLLAVVVPCAAMAEGGLSLLFGNRIANFLGEISYSIYLVHWPILLALRRALEKWQTPVAPLAVTCFVIVLVIGCACILFYAIELPVRRSLRNTFGVIDAKEK
jgi:peptidoglycan/LPS O-acetylase OafA/YrhL